MDTIAPFHGFGLGLRPPHYPLYLEEPPALDFVEAISENFMVAGGRPLHVLDRVRERYPVALHGVSMSLGSADGLDRDYLLRLKRLARRVRPLWVSDHLSWSAVGGFNAHDLLPLPYDGEALDVVCANIAHAQDVLERPLLLENPSTYLAFSGASMSEADFLREICARTGCYLLLDVNNVYVSASNHGADPQAYLDALPWDRVRQVHLAGHSQGRELLIDTHDQPICDPVWALYARVCQRIGAVATMIERDDRIPPLAELLDELQIARDIASSAVRAAA
ncbi:DUF692 domain-containing protein [Xanthomonas sp. CFBP 8703]|uniref:UPF0276 protein JR064_11270 n=1 Tax=Xanthomonas bonasiae TaxID=2810351 RepID=A0ABS3B280_9XANT|nr:DUF692 domain-containing protein [Xanthomonas bonasiae]MBN6102748.1 DUF692 domain-containing protein [Xanthomonas bonasiae]